MASRIFAAHLNPGRRDAIHLQPRNSKSYDRSRFHSLEVHCSNKYNLVIFGSNSDVERDAAKVLEPVDLSVVVTNANVPARVRDEFRYRLRLRISCES